VPLRVYGIDFTSRPGPGKPLTCAVCRLDGGRLTLERVDEWPAFAPFEELLASSGPWLAALDFPFGLPRDFVAAMGWPAEWPGYVSRVARLTREAFRERVQGFKAGRPPGRKDLRRVVDALARSASPLNVTRPPVGLMFYEGAPRLLASPAAVLPNRPRAGEDRVVVEAYPALVARRWLGASPYKEGGAAARAERRRARAALLDRLLSPAAERRYGFSIGLAPALAEALAADPAGDRLDALLCAVQGAWAARQADWGVPVHCDAAEGWIVAPELAADDPPLP
jgi:hypothetical protein